MASDDPSMLPTMINFLFCWHHSRITKASVRPPHLSSLMLIAS